MNIINQFTLKTLLQNKVRTIVTIIGITLSTAMFTSVTSVITSFLQYMVDATLDQDGAWEGMADGITRKQTEAFSRDKSVTSYTIMHNVGYSQIENPLNPSKPFLCITSIDKKCREFTSIKLIDGRMPERAEEILIPKHLLDTKTFPYKTGDTVTLQVGERTKNGKTLTGGQNTIYENPTIENTVSKTYRITGTYERPSFEPSDAMGYTLLTSGEEDGADIYCVYFKVKDARKINHVLNRITKKLNLSEEQKYDYYSNIHSELLRFRKDAPKGTFTTVAYRFGFILIIVIMTASISLIYNAFSISVSERIKQFGLLKSIGATKKQIRRSVLFEALSLCAVGIPLGIGSGLFGIDITLKYMNDYFSNVFFVENPDVSLHLVFSWESIIIPTVTALITIIISAVIPARKAIKMPAIQALRQNNDIRLKRSRLRTFSFVSRLFGLEGTLALKNMKRNRRKYRITVFSLAISIILFLSASCFSSYMQSSIDLMAENYVYDITAAIPEENNSSKKTPEEITQDISSLPHVDSAAYSDILSGNLRISTEQLNKNFLSRYKKTYPECIDSKNKLAVLDAAITFIEDSAYEKYLKKNNLDTARFLDGKNPAPLLWDTVGFYDNGKIFQYSVLRSTGDHTDLYLPQRKKDAVFLRFDNLKTMDLAYAEVDDSVHLEEEEEKQKIFSQKEACDKITTPSGEKINGKLPLGALDFTYDGTLTVILPHHVLENLKKASKYMKYSTSIQVQAKNHSAAAIEILEYYNGHQLGGSVQDYRENENSMRSMIAIINIFSYGFIILITLIVIANVFNTISTNIYLRRQEFAMLKSVGMTRKGFFRMMNFECVMYGAKGLLIGLPISYLLCFMMYRSLEIAWNVSFYMPKENLLIAIFSIFIVVFASMVYSMRKIQKDNLIEALRNENV